MRATQKIVLNGTYEKDGWIYTLRKHLTCCKPECKCHSGEYHDNLQYVFEKRKHTKGEPKSLGNVNDIGFPPNIIQHRLSDEEEASKIKEEVDSFLNKLKIEMNITDSPIANIHYDIISTKYFLLKSLQQQMYKSTRKLISRDKKDTTDLTKKILITMRELEESLNQIKSIKILSAQITNFNDANSTSKESYEDLLALV